jgi:hypothetical protein
MLAKSAKCLSDLPVCDIPEDLPEANPAKQANHQLASWSDQASHIAGHLLHIGNAVQAGKIRKRTVERDAGFKLSNLFSGKASEFNRSPAREIADSAPRFCDHSRGRIARDYPDSPIGQVKRVNPRPAVDFQEALSRMKDPIHFFPDRLPLRAANR